MPTANLVTEGEITTNASGLVIVKDIIDTLSCLGVKYPQSILDQKQLVEKLRAESLEEEKKLEVFVKEFQAQCSNHQWNKVLLGKKDKLGINTNELKYFQCAQCGKIRPRRQGLDINVCNRCDGDMKLVATIPGQGERLRIYECVNCKHEEQAT